MSRAFVALGGNLGDVLATFRGALLALAAEAGRVGAVSSAVRTPALVPPGAPPGPDYWNAAVELSTDLSPEALLAVLLGIEQRFGRERREKWAARTLDLDLLLFDDVARTAPDPVLPHPRLAERAFVLVPLAELEPSLVVPGTGRTVRELAAAAGGGVLETRERWER